MRHALCVAAFAAVAAVPPEGAGEGADAARIAADPGAYAGRAVTVEVAFSRIDPGREPWEEQGDLTTSRVIKFTASPLGGMTCYAARTPDNTDALAGLKRGARIVLSGAVKKYRPAVRAEYDVTGRGGGASRRDGPDRARRRRRGRRDDDRTEYGPERYVFMVESVSRAERRDGADEEGGGA